MSNLNLTEQIETETLQPQMLGAKYRCKLCGDLVIGRMIHFAEKHEDLALSNFEKLQEPGM